MAYTVLPATNSSPAQSAQNPVGKTSAATEKGSLGEPALAPRLADPVPETIKAPVAPLKIWLPM